MAEFETTMKLNENVSMKMSKFYVKQNQVIDNIADIEKKEDINNYLIDAAKNCERPVNSDIGFKGQYNKRQVNRENSGNEKGKIQSEPPLNNNSKEREAIDDGTPLGHFETEREKKIKLFKRNSARLLHERNKYVFLASVAEDAISSNLVTKMN